VEAVLVRGDREGAVRNGDAVMRFQRIFRAGDAVGAAGDLQVILGSDTVGGRGDVQGAGSVQDEIRLREDHGIGIGRAVRREGAGHAQRVLTVRRGDKHLVR